MPSLATHDRKIIELINDKIAGKPSNKSRRNQYFLFLRVYFWRISAVASQKF